MESHEERSDQGSFLLELAALAAVGVISALSFVAETYSGFVSD